jgi:GT2 family glycosyltransferase
MKPKVSIIIANWNGEAILEDCLRSIFEHTKRIPFEVIVVDDASTDRSIERVRTKFPEVCVIENEKNIGYAATNNRALTVARGEYWLLLNNDTILQNNAVELMASYLDAHTNVGICGGTLLNPDGSLQHSFGNVPSLKVELVGLFSLHRFYRKKPPPALGIIPYNIHNPIEVEMIVGADLMIRASLARELGLYDEAFNAYFEDTDLCFRAKKKGWKVIYLPEPKITHLYSYSFGNERVIELQKISRKSRYMANGYKRFCKKHYPLYWWLLVSLRCLTQLRLWVQHALLAYLTGSEHSKQLSAEYRASFLALISS